MKTNLTKEQLADRLTKTVLDFDHYFHDYFCENYKSLNDKKLREWILDELEKVEKE